MEVNWEIVYEKLKLVSWITIIAACFTFLSLWERNMSSQYYSECFTLKWEKLT